MAESEFVVTEFAARNEQALRALTQEHGIELRAFPDEVLSNLRTHSDAVMNGLAARDATFGRVYSSYQSFAASIANWQSISEGHFIRTRGG